MHRLNVYSTIDLSLEQKNALSDGFDMLGQYIGGISVARFALVKLPTDLNGEAGMNVACNSFDKGILFHVFAHPLKGANDPVRGFGGRSFVRTGVAHVDTRATGSVITATAAHEVAHGLGLVLPGAPQSIKATKYHCSCSECVLRCKITTGIEGWSQEDFESLQDTGVNILKVSGLYDLVVDAIVPTDFCSPCKADARGEHERLAGEIYVSRVLNNSVLTVDQIKQARVS